MLLLTPLGGTSEDSMPRTLTVAPVTISNVSGGDVFVNIQLLDDAGTVLAEATSTLIEVPADPTPKPDVSSPTITVS